MSKVRMAAAFAVLWSFASGCDSGSRRNDEMRDDAEVKPDGSMKQPDSESPKQDPCAEGAFTEAAVVDKDPTNQFQDDVRIVSERDGNVVLMTLSDTGAYDARLWMYEWHPNERAWSRSTTALNATGSELRVVEQDSYDLASNGAGTVVAAWSAYGKPYVEVRIRKDGTWRTAKLVDEDEAVARIYGVRVTTNPKGDALATWTREDTEGGHVGQAALYRGGRWGAVQSIPQSNAPSTVSLTAQPVLDTDGNALVVWARSMEGDEYHLESSRRLATSDWGPVTPLENHAEAVLPGDVVTDYVNSTFVVYRHHPTNDTRESGKVWARRFDISNQTFDQAEELSNDFHAHSLAPQLAIDSSGAATALYIVTKADGKSTPGLVSRTYTPKTKAWAGSKFVTADVLYYDLFTLDHDPATGVAFYTAVSWNGTDVFRGARSTSCDGFGSPRVFHEGTPVRNVASTVDSTGAVTVAWTQDGGLWFSRFEYE